MGTYTWKYKNYIETYNHGAEYFPDVRTFIFAGYAVNEQCQQSSNVEVERFAEFFQF